MAIFKADNYDGNVHHPATKFFELYCTSLVTAGGWVALQMGDTANPAGSAYQSIRACINTDADGPEGICGVAVDTLTAAGLVRVQVAGFYSGANVAATVVAGEILVASATSQRAQDSNQVAELDNYRQAGQAVTTASANASDVIIFPHPACSAA